MSIRLEAAGNVARQRAKVLLTTTFLAVAATSTLVPAAVFAQSYVFTQVKIEGNERIEPETILSYAALERGASVDAGTLNDAYQRIQGSGLFESVELVPQGSTLVIRVKEFPTVNVVDFEGNKMMKDDKLAPLIQTQPRKIYTPAMVEADAASIAEGYAASGRLAVRVDPKVIRRDGNRVDVVFEIQEGANSEVNRITFTGNRAYSDRRLRDVLSTKQAGILHRLIQRDSFIADRINLDRQQLLDFYHSRGYPDVQVTGVSSEMTRDREGFFMTFNINEGQQYKFGKITAVSEVAELDAKDFEKLTKIRAGAIYSPNAIDLAITRLEEQALRKGASFVRVDPRVTRDPRTQTLDIEFALVRGPRVFVERIDIEGNNTTLDSVIRREFNTVEGDPFNPREIRNSAERIRALGFFASADVNPRQGTAPDQVIVDVNVEEQPTGSLTFGASYGASQGFGLNASLEESNFLGRGQYLGVSIGTTKDNQQNSITFVEPKLLGRDLKGAFKLWYNTSSDDNSDYDTKRMGISPSLEFPLGRDSRLEVRYTWARDELSGMTSYDSVTNTGSSPILAGDGSVSNPVGEQGSADKSSLGYTYTWDTRRTGIDPRYGFTFRWGQDLYGFGGDLEALKTTALLRAERKVFHEDVTLRAELEGGAIVARGGSALTVLDRFNGYNAVRGFEANGWGPRDLGAPNQDALGGKYYAALRLEAEFPVGVPEEYGIHGGVFWDTGTLFGLDDTAGVATVDDGSHIRSSVGVSVFWDSALGPLRLNFSKAIKKEDYDEAQNFDLTISTKF